MSTARKAFLLAVVGTLGLAGGFIARPLLLQEPTTAGFVGKDQQKAAPRAVHFNIKDANWEKHPEFGGSEWVFYRSADGKRVGAAWQESGKVSFTYPFDELLYVLKGRAKVNVHGGEKFELVEGDVAYFEEGATVDFEFSEGFTDVTMLVSDKEVKWR